MNGREAPRWTGRRVLIALLLFFGLVAAVNGIMVWLALESWPGRSTRDLGRDEGNRLAASAVRRTPGERDGGWTG